MLNWTTNKWSLLDFILFLQIRNLINVSLFSFHITVHLGRSILPRSFNKDNTRSKKEASSQNFPYFSFTFRNVSDHWDIFKGTLISVIEKYFPLKSIFPKI